MKCKICGAESDQYPLCWECNKKKEKGEVIKCAHCGQWHYTNLPCSVGKETAEEKDPFLYRLKPALVTDTEKRFLDCLREVLPKGYLIQPQANLASFIQRTDGARYQNELYRNIDFIVTDIAYRPVFLVEINDQTHLTQERQKRDRKVTQICEEAGIPLIKLWTSYGVNEEYIKKRVLEVLSSLPPQRVHHFNSTSPKTQEPESAPLYERTKKEKKGCYIATCVYGNYDCPQVWTLRRFRDQYLEASVTGRLFIELYYKVSPLLVAWFGKAQWFKRLWKWLLDSLVDKLQTQGIESTPYQDV